MLEVYGRKIPETIEELVEPSHTAVVVVDAQNDFCTKGGLDDKYGRRLVGYPETIENIRRLIAEARRVGVLVVYTMNTSLPNHASDSAAYLRFLMRGWTKGDPAKIPIFTLEGTWGEQIVDELKPTDKDVIVKKNRASGFVQTNMDLVLKAHKIRTLVMTGFVSNGCVYATARDGSSLDYFIVVGKDCVNSARENLHSCALTLMEARFDVFTSDQLISTWRKIAPR